MCGARAFIPSMPIPITANQPIPRSSLSCWQETSAASSPTSALSSNANQLDRPARSDRVLLRRGHKLLVAPLGAKVIGLPLVLLARRGRSRVDLHPAHRVGHRRHHFPLPSFVVLGIMPAPSNGAKRRLGRAGAPAGCRPVG